MSKRAKMPEKQTHTIARHLDEIAERGGDSIVQMLNETLGRVALVDATEGAHRERTYDEMVDLQPDATRVLNDIAYYTKLAHAEQGNHVDDDDTWERSIELVVNATNTAVNAGEAQAAEDHALTLVTMLALHNIPMAQAAVGKGSAVHTVLPCSEMLRKVLIDEGGAPQLDSVLEQAVNKARAIGLCVNVGLGDQFEPAPVGNLVMNTIYDFRQKREEDFRAARIEAFVRRDISLNDSAMERLIAQQSEKSRANPSDDWMRNHGTESSDVLEIIESGNYSIDALTNYIENIVMMAQRENDAHAKGTKHADSIDKTIDELMLCMPRGVLQEVNRESDVLENVLAKEVSRHDLRHGDIKRLMNLASGMYGMNPIQLKRRRRFLGPTITDLTERPEYLRRAIASIEDFDRNEYSSDAEYVVAVDAWVKDCMEYGIGMPHDLASETRYAMDLRTRERDGQRQILASGAPDIAKLHRYLNYISDIAEKVGIDGMSLLRRRAGIVSFDRYSVAQMDRMYRLLSGDEQLVDTLRQGDVTAVFVDGKGDHNGAFSRVIGSADKPSGRTLYFEINGPTDLYNYSLYLQRMGIGDSTRILCAHGGNGTFRIGQHGDKNAFGVSARDHGVDESRTFNANAIEIIRRMAESHMRPSQAVDDPEEQKGKKRVVIVSCNQAQEYTSEGVVYPPVVEAIAAKINDANTEVYGAVDSVSTTIEDGRMMFKYERVKGSNRWLPTKVRRFSVERDSSTDGSLPDVSYDDVEDVQLWKT